MTVWTPGVLGDISVSGATIESAAVPGLEVGGRTVIHFGQLQARVEVRRLVPTDRPYTWRYGVQFLDIDPQLRERIHGLLGEGRPYERPGIGRAV